MNDRSGTGFTVSVAAALVTVPTVLLTTSRNVDPLSAVAGWFAGGVVIVGATTAGVPVPESVMVIVGICGSLLVMVILPESVPVVVGENATVNVELPLGAIVLGVVIPETPNGRVLTEIKEMIRLTPPALVIVSVRLAVAPIIALPKFRLVELTPICCDAAVCGAGKCYLPRKKLGCRPGASGYQRRSRWCWDQTTPGRCWTAQWAGIRAS